MDIEVENQTIAVIDDNDINRFVETKLLSKMFTYVDEYKSGKDYLNQYKRHDIIIIDYMMPDMDGIDTLLRLEQFSDTMSRCYICTAFPFWDIQKLALVDRKPWFCGVLRKPLFAERFYEMVKTNERK